MMAKIGELLVKIGADASGLVKELRKSEQDVQSFGKNMQAIGGKLKKAGAVMTAAVTVPLVAAGTASFKLAADMEDALGATDQIYKGSSEAVKSWAKGLKTYYGIAQGEALEYSNMMGSLLQNIGGLSEAEAAKMSGQLVELAGDLTAMFGGTTEDAVRALTGALKGNNTMLDNYGMAVNDALVKQKALDMGLIKGKEGMTLQAKQAATLALIMEQSAAAQGQAAREADGASGSMRIFQTEMKNLGTSIGTELLPVITPLLTKLNNLVKGFGKLSPEGKRVIVVVGAIVAAIGPVLIGLGMMASAVGSISLALPVLGTALTGAGAAFSALVWPIGLAVGAVVGIIAIFKRLWDTSPKFREWARGIGDSIETFFVGKINRAIDGINLLIRGLNKVTDWDVPEVNKLAAPSGTQGMGTFQAMQRYAVGTNFHPGGLAWVGERGPELVNLPRGAQVLNNRDSMAMLNQSLTISGTVRVEGVTDMGQLVGVTKIIAKEIEQGDRRLAGRVRVMPSMA